MGDDRQKVGGWLVNGGGIVGEGWWMVGGWLAVGWRMDGGWLADGWRMVGG